MQGLTLQRCHDAIAWALVGMLSAIGLVILPGNALLGTGHLVLAFLLCPKVPIPSWLRIVLAVAIVIVL